MNVLKKNKNYKVLIGLILGVLLSATGVYAATTYVGSGVDLSYSNSSSGLSSTNVQDALDELYINGGTGGECPTGYKCLEKKTTLALGDYVSLTPTKSSYTTDTSKTGYTSTQTINPQELNLWRVISLNDDGTVDIISEHVSSTEVYFSGQTGYQNLVGYLNVLASQYENSTYTTGSRYFGYNGQTEYITDTSKFTNPAPWTCSTGDSCSPVESQGGGDTLYTTDYNLVNTVLGTRMTTNPSGTAKAYWMASRYYLYNSSTLYYWNARYVKSIGSFSNVYLYYYSSSSFITNSTNAALRPILTLKSGLKYSGVGIEEAPMEISTS